MSVSRANLKSAPAKITWNGATFYTRDDVSVQFSQTWEDIVTSCFDVVDAVETDRQIKISLTLWGAWESISTLFPAAFMNPTAGSRLYGTTDLPMVIHAKGSSTTDRLTIHNVQITKLSDLYLGLDNTIFAQCEFTGLIKNSANPETAASYFTLDTAAYTDSGFAFTNYNRQRYSATWRDDAGTPAIITGFNGFQAHKGWNLSWEMRGDFEYNANVGTVDYIIRSAVLSAKCNQILGPTMAELSTARRADGRALGKRAGESRGTLVITADTASPTTSITINKAAITDAPMDFGQTKLLYGDVTWKSYRAFSAGVPSAMIVIA